MLPLFGHWANSEECPAVQRAIKIREGSREERVAKSRSPNKITESEEKSEKVQKNPAAWSQTDFPKLQNKVLNFSPANPESWPKPESKQNDTSTIQEIISLLKKFEYFCYFDKNTKNSQDAHQG